MRGNGFVVSLGRLDSNINQLTGLGVERTGRDRPDESVKRFGNLGRLLFQ